jgi:hypothetical protein
MFNIVAKLTSRVKSIDINGKVDRVLGADSVSDLLDDSVGSCCMSAFCSDASHSLEWMLTDGVDFTSLDDLEAAITVVLIVRGSRKGRPDAGMDVGVVLQETFHGSMVEVGSVIDSSNLTRRAAKDLGLPCVPGPVKLELCRSS